MSKAAAVGRAPRRKRSRHAPAATAHYELILFISGATENSRAALANVKVFTEKHLRGHCRLTVVDLYQQPQLAREHDITAVPMLIRKAPPPMRRMIGNLSNEERVLAGLELASLAVP